MLNNQKPEPSQHGDGETLDIIEIFHTLQGEGPFSGQAAIFIRLAGCNLMCPGCDTQYTVGRQRRSVASIVHVVEAMRASYPNTSLVVITGGEPLRQNLDELVRVLLSVVCVRVQIESNGVLPLGDFLRVRAHSKPTVQGGYANLFYIVSPKTHRIHADAYEYACAFKYVLEAGNIIENDGLPIQALGHKVNGFVARPPTDRVVPVYVNPMDSQDPVKNDANMVAARDSALRFGYILGVQLHKIVNLP